MRESGREIIIKNKESLKGIVIPTRLFFEIRVSYEVSLLGFWVNLTEPSAVNFN